MKKVSRDRTEGPDDEIAPAFYEGKEAWKSQPGNRYTAEELKRMEEEWDVRIAPPPAVHVRRAD